MLKQRGIQRIFGVPGGGSSLDLIEAAAEQDIDFVLCRTETGAAIMAAVTGELTGISGIVLTGIGPGAASAVNGITYASLERAPLLSLLTPMKLMRLNRPIRYLTSNLCSRRYQRHSSD